MTEFMAQPDDLGDLHASELHAPLMERLGAQAGEAFGSGTRTLLRLGEFSAAEGNVPDFGGPIPPELADMFDPAKVPTLPIADAKARLKQEGLEQHVKLPEQPTIKQPVLDLMIAHGHERREYEAAVNRGPQGFGYDALGFVTQLGAGMIDPVNIAAFSIPVLGEARYGMMIAGAGESLAARAGVKAVTGAAQGAVGSTALVPGDWWLHTKDGVDYTMADALHSIVLGAGMGGAFHAGFGAIGDARARLSGEALRDSLTDLRERAVAGDVKAAALLDRLGQKAKTIDLNEPVSTPDEGVPGVEPPRPEASPIEELLRDAPPSAIEELFRRAKPSAIEQLFSHAGEGRQAVWANAEHDLPVSVLDEAPQAGPDGRLYQKVRFDGRDSFVPADELRGPHPAEVLADLPPRVREDVARASVADVINGNPVRAGELLEEAAKESPRIAESVELGRGTPEQPAKGPAAAEPQHQSLIQFLASRGGIRNDDPLIGDVRGSIGRDNHFVPGHGNLIRKPRELSTAARRGGASAPMTLDQAREAAVEAGYLIDHGTEAGGTSTTTVRTLLDAVDRELRGERVYPHDARASDKAGTERMREEDTYRREGYSVELDKALEEVGLKGTIVPDSTRARVVELMHKEGVADPLEAYERAVMEETNHVTQAGQAERIRDHIPGWDVPDDAGAASRAGGPAAAGGPSGPRGAARQPGAGDRSADWQRFREPRADDAELVTASNEAAAEHEAQSTVPEKSLTAAEKAAADAEQLLTDLRPQLTEAERAAFDEALAKLDKDSEERADMVRQGAACLAAAVG